MQNLRKTPLRKRTLALFLAILTLAALFPVLQVSAGITGQGDSIGDAMSELNIKWSGEYLNWLKIGGEVAEQRYTYFTYWNERKQANEDHPVYCITPDRGGAYESYNGTSIRPPNQHRPPDLLSDGLAAQYFTSTSIPLDDPVLHSILDEGFPQNSLQSLGLLGYSDEHGYYATKIALWTYLKKGLGAENQITKNGSGAVYDAVLTAAREIYRRGTAYAGNTPPTPTIQVKPAEGSNTNASLDSGKTYFVQELVIEANTWVGEVPAAPGSFALSWETAAPVGTIVLDKNGTDITASMTTAPIQYVAGADGGFYFKTSITVKFPVSAYPEAVEALAKVDAGEEVDVTVQLPKLKATGLLQRSDNLYIAYHWKDLPKYLADQLTHAAQEYQMYLVTSDTKIETDGKMQPFGYIRADVDDLEAGLLIRKVETGTGKPLPGAVFEISDPDGIKVSSLITDAQGLIHLDTRKVGMYTVTEISPPQYHTLPANPTQQVRVEYDTVAEVTFYNDPYGSLLVSKIDSKTSRALAGATIEIKHISSGYTDSKVTASNGIVTFTNIPVGAYRIRELTAPVGYELDTTTYTQNVLPQNEGITQFTISNDALAGLRIRKFDADLSIPIAGVTFEVYRNSAPFGVFVTDELGEILLTNIPSGTYIAREVNTVGSYILDETAQWIDIAAGDGIKELQFWNTLKPGMDIIKVDSRDGTRLSGAQFRIERVGGGFSNEYTTDGNGEINLDFLPPGSYRVTELAAPAGYLIDNNTRVIELVNGRTAKFVFTNTELPSFELLKYDPVTDQYLSGAMFRIAKIEDGTHYLDRITDTNGKIHISGTEGLSPGVYSVREIAAPGNYVLNDREYHVLLTPGRTAQLVVHNEKKPNMQIVKTDANSGAPIANVTFTVRKVDSATVTTVTTGPDGTALIEHLDPGVYQVIEQSVPDAYILDTTPQLITLFPNRTGVVRFQNYPKVVFLLTKTDIDNVPIPGVTFNIAKKGGASIGNYTTDSNGLIQINKLDPGYYIITEKAVPDAYILDSTPREEWLEAGKTLSIHIENHRKPELTVLKLDSVTKDPLAGARYHIWYATNGSLSGQLEDLGIYSTDADGKFTLTKQKVGWYRIEEIEAPTGYQLPNPAIQEVFLQNDMVKTVTFENIPKSAIVIRKIDNETALPVSGASFRVRYFTGVSGTGGTIIFEGVTSVNGTITITGCKPGTYEIEEYRAATGYELSNPSTKTVYLSGEEQTVVTVEFTNQKKGELLIKKLDSVTKQPVAGATFKVTDSSGAAIGPNNGEYVTDQQGLINVGEYLSVGSTVIVQEIKAPNGYVIDTTEQSIKIKENTTHTLTFFNTPKTGLQILKLDKVTRRPIPGTTFSVAKLNGEIIGSYRTDWFGIINLPTLDSGWYVVTETEATVGYLLDTTPHNVEIKAGKPATIEITNVPLGGFRLTKIDAFSKQPIYNTEFMLFDSGNNVLGTYYTDNNGVIYAMGQFPTGRYSLRETRPSEGYYPDETPRTIEIIAGRVTEIRWENTPQLGQIQITKKSGDDNEPNALPAGTLLEGAVFEIYNYKSGNLVDRIVSGRDGRAVSKPIPLGRYIVKEVQAPKYYRVSTQQLDIDIEFATQIVKVEFLNYSANTGVSIKKTGNVEAMPGDTIRYDIKEVRNTSTVPLSDFYWRDILPADAVRLNKIVTGTYNQSLKYKIMVTLNTGETRLIADNLVSTKNNTVDCSPWALGLNSSEYVVNVTFLFGTVKAGFSQVVQPQVHVDVLKTLTNGYKFVNKADVGGKYDSEWIIATANWTTTVFNPKTVNPPKLPRTGY
jgi:uncharacterized repeat protein (TIGR01451 family)